MFLNVPAAIKCQRLEGKICLGSGVTATLSNMADAEAKTPQC